MSSGNATDLVQTIAIGALAVGLIVLALAVRQLRDRTIRIVVDVAPDALPEPSAEARMRMAEAGAIDDLNLAAAGESGRAR